MIYLALAILGSGIIPVLFRAFDGWRVNVFWAIPINYLTCAVVGQIWAGHPLDLAHLPRQSWFGLAACSGGDPRGKFFFASLHRAARGRGGRGVG